VHGLWVSGPSDADGGPLPQLCLWTALVKPPDPTFQVEVTLFRDLAGH
jgi:hypothetical protein